jgi:hypothetical protein
METVNKYVNAASTVIWGDNSPEAQKRAAQHGEEPMSGVQGTGAATDPYDGGNREGKYFAHTAITLPIQPKSLYLTHQQNNPAQSPQKATQPPKNQS